MCAIAGFNWKNETLVRGMTADLAYRGPDATGVFTEEGISLGHDRLAVIDLSSAANQPMLDAHNDLAIVFNGEIYNFRELRDALKGSYTFKTSSDTEVLLAAYRVWGKGMVERLNGMFAFALWDRRNRSLFCARDRMGVKPFFYYWDGARFIFASELKTLLMHDIPRRLDRTSFNHFLRLLYVPAPHTLVENVFVLPPSHTLRLVGVELAVEAYNTDPVTPTTLSYGEAVGALKDTVLASVQRHLIADVPVGVYLSGGIDSSVVLAATTRFHQNVKTFTVGFELGKGEEREKFNQDLHLARRTAKHFGTDHHELIISMQDALDGFAETAIHNSSPVSNPTAIVMRLLGKFARTKVTAVLTGNAGDELFGGYDRYRMALLAERFMSLPEPLRGLGKLHPRIAKLDYGAPVDLFVQFMFQKDEKLARVVAPNMLSSAAVTRDLFVRKWFSGDTSDLTGSLMRADQHSWLPDHFFTLADQMSMANALEERVPFADVEVLTFAQSLPTSYKVGLMRTKKILKDAFRNDLPQFLFRQPKRGWFSPAAKWFRNAAFADFARSVLSPEYYAGSKDLFLWDEVRGMLEDHIAKRRYNLNILWALFVFQRWSKLYKIQP